MDDKFWEIIEKMALAFHDGDVTTLSKACEEKRLLGLYKTLEISNLEFIRKCMPMEMSDDSDSDCEFSIPGDKRRYRLFKILSETAINTAQLDTFCVKNIKKQKIHVL